MAQYRIKELLKERNMTQKDLARKIGVSAVTLNRYITGNPSVSSLEKIAGALDVEISELFVHWKGDETNFDSPFKCPCCGFQLHLVIKEGGTEHGKESI